MAPFFPRHRARPDYDVIQRRVSKSPEDAPSLSIVVPFYKEWRFVFPLLKLVDKAPRGWEWVFVCDDPSIYGAICKYLNAQIPANRERITLVRMRRNCGFGAANNVGAEEAGADTVLFMNSDIWVANFAPFFVALEAIASGRYGLLGFTLLFEDGTLQHDGMSLEAKPDFDDLYLAMHPGKGLPLSDSRAEMKLRDADVVTGALMMMRKSLFLEIGGFSGAYIGGDFEDADLCLQLRQRGRQIGVVECETIFHLERQSIRKDAENAVAFARTLINCVTFNTAWREFIGATQIGARG